MIYNVLFGGKVTDQDITDEKTGTIQNLNMALLQDQRVSLSMLLIEDEVTLLRKCF